jgi:FtsZ-binding cell division protein ZapB
MISLEQVQLLEMKVARAIEYIQRLSSENSALSTEKANLHGKLEASQKRLDELEMLVLRFKEDQGRIEDGIIAALDRLNQFEEAFESGLKSKASSPVSVKKPPVKKAVEKPVSLDAPVSVDESPLEEDKEREFFEIYESENPNEELEDELSSKSASKDSSFDGELDIF